MSTRERRFRRLLLAYPRGHREVYGEEVVGVLFAAAEPGRQGPGWRDGLDVIRGGARVRLRRLEGSTCGGALAIVSVVALALLCSLAPLGAYAGYAILRSGGSAASLAEVAHLLGWPLVLGLALIGRRTAATVLSAGLAARWLHDGDQSLLALRDGWAALAVTATAGLARPP